MAIQLKRAAGVVVAGVAAGLFASSVPGAGTVRLIAQRQRPSAPSTPRLYVFDCGQLYIADPRGYSLKKEEVSTPFLSVPCFLVVHPKGTLIWDVGEVPDSKVETAGPDSGRGAIRPPKRTLKSQLSEIGYSPADVDYLALSHHHFDHSANANDYAGATWLVRQVEKDVMFGDVVPYSTTPGFYSALKTSKTTIVSGNYDVFGDGTVVLLSTPGHTPGHQALFVKLAKTGAIVLAGDLYHYPEERTLNRIPPTEFSVEETAASRAALEVLLKMTGAELWIEHDFAHDATLKKSPAYYE
jgi:glyoxylase-like metal-dependent hydrolase (beta-lactamase superfamily II)